jgi:hypothetical protein
MSWWDFLSLLFGPSRRSATRRRRECTASDWLWPLSSSWRSWSRASRRCGRCRERGRSEFVAAAVVVLQFTIAIAITSLLWRKRRPAFSLSARRYGDQRNAVGVSIANATDPEAGGLLVVVADPTISA